MEDHKFEEFLIDRFKKHKDTIRSKTFCKITKSILNDLLPDVNSKIIDVGCAFNVYKQFYPKLIGIDFVEHENVDIVTSTKDFNPEENSFDGAICLGVFHGDSKYVKQNFQKVLSWVKKNGYIVMRCRASLPNYEFCLKDPVEWNNKTILEFENLYNLKRLDIHHTVTKGKTISNVWVWQKN